MPIARKENMVTALSTDGDKPAITAKDHRNRRLINKAIVFPFFVIFCIGFNNKLSSNSKIPTCKPDTARI
ncbi:hypothetical protein GCM10022258_31340 [Aquimarina gracilis]